MNNKTEEYKRGMNEDTLLSLYFRESELNLPILERCVQDELFAKMNSTKKEEEKQKIRNEIINHNLKLVVLIAKDYDRLGLEKADLISEGNLGLMVAVDRFDTSKNCKFSHYAGIWIRQRIRKALVAKGRTIRLPYRALSLKIDMTKFMESFKGKYGRLPSDFEVAKKLKISLKKVKSLSEIQINIPSLNALVGNGDGNIEEIGNIVPDAINLPADEMALAKENIDILNKFLGKLNERDRDVIFKRFGVNKNKESTLEEIGHIYGVTKERVRQIEEKALLKLRKMIKSEMKVRLPALGAFDFRSFDVIDPLLCKSS